MVLVFHSVSADDTHGGSGSSRLVGHTVERKQPGLFSLDFLGSCPDCLVWTDDGICAVLNIPRFKYTKIESSHVLYRPAMWDKVQPVRVG